MRTIALFGASGQTGRRVLARALARGDAVHALVRDQSRLPPQPGLTVTIGDARERSVVDHVVGGSHAVVCCLGMQDITAPASDFSDSVRTIVDAARDAGVRRVIAIASAVVLPHPDGGLRAEHDVPPFLANIVAEHARNYETLRRSGLDWTLLCPVDLKADLPPGHARIAYDDLPAGGHETGYDDLAQTIVAMIDDRATVGHRIGIVSDRTATG
jgi:putative NADH-flavin reductase